MSANVFACDGGRGRTASASLRSCRVSCHARNKWKAIRSGCHETRVKGVRGMSHVDVVTRIKLSELHAQGEAGLCAREAAALALHRDGVFILDVGSSLLPSLVENAFKTARKFFSLDSDLKNLHRSEKQGFKDDPVAGFESFEVCSVSPQRYRWPAQPRELKNDFVTLQMEFRALAEHILDLCLTHLGVGEGEPLQRMKAELLDDPKQMSLETCSPTCLRFMNYTGTPARGMVALKNSVHSDNSLVTLAPRSSCPALQIRLFRSGTQVAAGGCWKGPWLEIEEQMTESDLIVFAGDSLALLSGHYFPALVHRIGSKGVSSPLDAIARGMQSSDMDGPRLSTPFFFRPRPNAFLQVLPANVAPRALSVSGGSWGVTFDQIAKNDMLCRDNWPWKRTLYYADQEFVR